MIPEIIETTTPQMIQYPSKTYKLDVAGKRIAGFIDGLDAIRQAVYKTLQTERYAYLIYSNNYGTEMERFIGEDFDYIKASIEGEIKEALYQDDRILNVTDFNIIKQGLDSCMLSFLVETSAGTTEIRQVVKA